MSYEAYTNQAGAAGASAGSHQHLHDHAGHPVICHGPGGLEPGGNLCRYGADPIRTGGPGPAVPQHGRGGSAGLGGLPDTETDEEGVVWKVFTEGEYGLRVGVAPEEDGSLRVVSWRMEKEWEPDEDMNLWDGF